MLVTVPEDLPFWQERSTSRSLTINRQKPSLRDPRPQSFHPVFRKPYNLGGRPNPVIVAIRDNKNYIRVLLYSYYTTITGWGVLLTYNANTLSLYTLPKPKGKFPKITFIEFIGS